MGLSDIRWSHRVLRWPVALVLLGFALTGLLHPVMVRFSPQPETRLPPRYASLPMGISGPSAALQAAGVDKIAGLRPLLDNGALQWRVTLPGSDVRYLNQEGQLLADAESRHAFALAKHYAPKHAWDKPTLVRKFDGDYPYVGRLLPVWRLESPEGLYVYVSTDDDRLAALNDPAKRLYQRAFHWLHNGAALSNALRAALWFGVLGLIAVMTLLGLTLLVRAPQGRRKNPRKFHRWVGGMLMLPLMAWVLSGAWQLWDAPAREQLPPQCAQRTVDAAGLTIAPPSSQARLITYTDAPLWWQGRPPRAAGAANHHHGSASAGKGLGDTPQVAAATGDTASLPRHAQLAAALATHCGLPPDAKWDGTQTHFDAEYGFLHKRLPVERFVLGNQERYYLELATGSLAAHTQPWQRQRDWVFAHLHKWDFMEDWTSKNLRDIVQSLVVAGLIVLAALGLWIGRRRT